MKSRRREGTAKELTEEDEPAKVLELAPLRRKVRLFEDVLRDSNQVGNVVHHSVVEQERYGVNAGRQLPPGLRRKDDGSSQETDSLPGLYMLVMTNSMRWKKAQLAR